MADVAMRYLDHAQRYYAGSTELYGMESTCWPIEALYAELPASEFGAMQFKACREW